MLSSYRVTCPYPGCCWSGSVIPSGLQGGQSTDVVSGKRAWLQCPQCKRNWEVRITGEKATALPAPEQGG